MAIVIYSNWWANEVNLKNMFKNELETINFDGLFGVNQQLRHQNVSKLVAYKIVN